MVLGLDKVSTKSAWRRNNKMSEIEQKVRKNNKEYTRKDRMQPSCRDIVVPLQRNLRGEMLPFQRSSPNYTEIE